jgi:muconolactone delta-isomerase
MNQFMIDITLPELLTQEFVSLIPQQRAQVNKLFTEGKLSSYALALDRSRLWVTMLSESEEEVIFILSTFPLRKFMDVRVHRLAFTESANAHVARISLN